MAKVVYRRGAREKGRFWIVRGLARRIGWALLSFVDRLLPKRRKRLVLSADKGLKYNGNPRELFEDLVVRPDWDVYWLSASPSVLSDVNRRYPSRGLRAWSLKALYKGLTSQWLCISHSRYDLGPFAYLMRPRFLYLNHGTPLKTMGFAKAYNDPGAANAANAFGAVTCCSPFEAGLWSRAYKISTDIVWVTGVPRNDRLFRRDNRLKARLGIPDDRKVVLFAPTYRETGTLDDYLPVPGLNGAALLAILERYDAVMLVRPHYYEWDAARRTVTRLDSERFVSADESIVADVNDLLPITDLLITDYSSIYFDFLLLDRPVIFSCYDLEAYERERGFMIDYASNTPGFKVRTPDDLLNALEAELSGSDPHGGFRQVIRERFHQYADGHASDRIAERIAGPGRA